MSDLFNPEKKFTQGDIAKLLSISDRQVRNLINKGILPAAKGRDGMNPLACLHAYISFKSQTGEAEPKSEASADEEEKLGRLEFRLKLEDKKETILFKKAKRVVFEKTFGPIQMIIDVLQQVGGRLASRHESLIPKMKLAWPDMPHEAVEVLENELMAAVNECADVLPDLTDYEKCSDESGSDWLVGDEDLTEDNWNELV